MATIPAKKPAAKPVVNKTEKVNEFMDKLDHPFKVEVQAVREIIKNVNKDITEEINLIFHNGAILEDKSGLLQGDYVDRRMVYFSDMKDVKVKAKRAALEKAVRKWVSE